MFNGLINGGGHMPEYWLMVGLLRDEYRRAYYAGGPTAIMNWTSDG